MQCKFCGQNLPDGATSCTRCGGNLAPQAKKPVQKQKIVIPEARREEFIFNIKPVFDPVLVFIRTFLISLLLSAVSVVTIGSFCVVILSLLGFTNCFHAFWVVGLTVFLASTIIITNVAKKNISARKFTFYQTKLEYTFNAAEGKFKHLDYNSILDSSVSKGFLQSMQKVGNISFVCAGSPRNYIVTISDVRNPEDIYKKIVDLIEVRKSMG